MSWWGLQSCSNFLEWLPKSLVESNLTFNIDSLYHKYLKNKIKQSQKKEKIYRLSGNLPFGLWQFCQQGASRHLSGVILDLQCLLIIFIKKIK